MLPISGTLSTVFNAFLSVLSGIFRRLNLRTLIIVRLDSLERNRDHPAGPECKSSSLVFFVEPALYSSRSLMEKKRLTKQPATRQKAFREKIAKKYEMILESTSREKNRACMMKHFEWLFVMNDDGFAFETSCFDVLDLQTLYSLALLCPSQPGSELCHFWEMFLALVPQPSRSKRSERIPLKCLGGARSC